MNHDDLHATLLCMERFGGTFCTKLAEALRYADPSNRQKILNAFPELVEKYGPTGPFQRSMKAPVA
jgi:2-oxo-4-hydroxy-4-carboxy--5-ureidoimidazoline (OHCU) decarboxylase